MSQIFQGGGALGHQAKCSINHQQHAPKHTPFGAVDNYYDIPGNKEREYDSNRDVVEIHREWDLDSDNDEQEKMKERQQMTLPVRIYNYISCKTTISHGKSHHHNARIDGKTHKAELDKETSCISTFFRIICLVRSVLRCCSWT